MATRKGWDSLSPPQRRRYQRAGISPSGYESGVSLSAARGHGSTPERPSAAQRHPDDFRPYLRRKGPGMRVVTTDGVQVVYGLSDRERSRVGSHDNAVRNFLNTSEIRSPYTSRLSEFDGLTVTGYPEGLDETQTVELETHHAELEWLESRGELSFESVYEKKAS